MGRVLVGEQAAPAATGTEVAVGSRLPPEAPVAVGALSCGMCSRYRSAKRLPHGAALRLRLIYKVYVNCRPCMTAVSRREQGTILGKKPPLSASHKLCLLH